MMRIVHLSDLHFGAHDPALIAPLIDAVGRARPDLTVISGDFAQRGTRPQWQQAEAFLNALPGPQLSIPGNHDIPHYNPLLRAFAPYARFRRATGGPDEPVWRNPRVVVAGINTADRWQWMRGKVSTPHIEGLGRAFEGAGNRHRIAVMHHPLEHAAVTVDPLMRGADDLMQALPGMGVRLVLSGHIHVSHIAPFRDDPGILFVQNGTSLSTRLRGEANVFLLLELEGQNLRVTRHYATPRGFVAAAPESWFLEGGVWLQPAPRAARAQLPR
ncbi:metallophosphoesterase family protein [Pararhodobacter sp.]|uniref:metallophosphoesterase family protein n=1 Tax=Pararhodobacter sp. TaxID=2127056 RepID=UPI002FE1BD0F